MYYKLDINQQPQGKNDPKLGNVYNNIYINNYHNYEKSSNMNQGIY